MLFWVCIFLGLLGGIIIEPPQKQLGWLIVLLVAIGGTAMWIYLSSKER